MRTNEKIDFDQMNREQRNAIFEIMDFASELAKQNGGQSARNHANYLCKKIISLFDSEKILVHSSKIIPFRGGDLT